MVAMPFPSLGAHSACQFSTADIRKTWEWSTNAFNRVQQSTILVGMATGNILWVPVNTDEVGWMLVAMICSHQVPLILLGPSRRTVIPSRHHQHWATWLDEADNAWRIMIVEISLKRVTAVLTHFIFSTVHVSGVLMAICVLVIPWIVWKAEVVRSTTMVSVAFSAYYTWYKEKIYQQLFFEIDVGTVFSVFCQLAKLIDILLCVIFLTYTLSVTVLTWWVAPPKMFCNWYRI